MIQLSPLVFVKNEKIRKVFLTDFITHLAPMCCLAMLPVIVPTSTQTHETVVFKNVPKWFIYRLR